MVLQHTSISHRPVADPEYKKKRKKKRGGGVGCYETFKLMDFGPSFTLEKVIYGVENEGCSGSALADFYDIPQCTVSATVISCNCTDTQTLQSYECCDRHLN